MLTLKTTPFHARTRALMQGNQWRRWAGHTVASAYELTPDREQMAIRNSAALIAVSPLFKYHIRGEDAERFLQRLVTRDLTKMDVGHVVYTPWCDGRGKVVDDGTISKISKSFFRLTAGESNLRWLGDNAAGFSVEIEEVSDALGVLSLQGPRSREILEVASGTDLSGLGYHRFTDLKLCGEPTMVSRTGYTGDLGYEIWIPRARALGVWDVLMDAGRASGIAACGIWAMDVCRIEAGLIMLDVDYTPAPRAQTEAQASSPFEIGLGWAVHFDKRNFVGRKALLEEKRRGPTLSLVGLEIDHAAFMEAHEKKGLTTPYPFIPWRQVTPLFQGREQVGYATCGTWSPTLKKYIALAQVSRSVAKPGAALVIDLMVDRTRDPFRATVVRIPFFNPERKRA
jgi:aminomethyltransferase